MSLPPSEIPQGAIRFNTDSQKLEFYAQGEWWVMSSDTPNLASAGDSTPGARGLYAGGSGVAPAPGARNEIDYINIATTGNALDFGNLSSSREWATIGCASRTRGIAAGGFTPAVQDVIDFVTIASTGNATDFGNLIDSRAAGGGCSNQTRGLFGGGNPAADSSKTNSIEYITIASTGNAQDFGDLLAATASITSATANTIRGLWSGGYTPTVLNTIQFVTIATLGNTQDFGDTTSARYEGQAVASATRGIFASGGPSSTAKVTIDYVTIASTGNATDFGDLIQEAQSTFGGGNASSTRGVFATDNSGKDDLEYVIIQTTGNAVDFGDLNLPRDLGAAFSNGHGGL
ncbi:MAG: hypothetical protein ACXADH_18115 [Candidatus Kariarchaeaceae archaeon]